MKTWIIRIIALLLCGVLLLGLVATVFADEVERDDQIVYGNIITIHSVEDLLAFAENCRMDTFSKGLYIYLENDLDLSDVDFAGIPIFYGTFIGNGHTISGLQMTGEGSFQGLFRYIMAGAVVSDLTVKGTIMPTGSRSNVGGIAGSNAGTVKNCVFVGEIAGVDAIGGIVGVNETTGVVEGCRTEGVIYGHHFVGGIAGINRGQIQACTNLGKINTTEIQNSVNLEDITIDNITDAESSITITDIGGIAGGSDGVVTGCMNDGTVGYPYMGYNIGGIVGNNGGYIFECANNGEIRGRKEVGGIAGQLEPFISVEFSKDTLQILQEQVDELSDRITALRDHTEANVGRIESLVDQLEKDMTALETALDRLYKAVEDPKLESLEDVQTLASTIETLLGNIQTCIRNIGTTADTLQEAIDDTTSGFSSDMDDLVEQLDVIQVTLDNASENLGGTVEDVSKDDTQELTSAEIADCRNAGKIVGDLNVGGILGTVAMENDLDPEEDVDILGENTLNYDAQVRAVVRGCVNTAVVQGRKYQIGGIVGFALLGLVEDCGNIATVAMDGADYVGGIVGMSQGLIRNCAVRCRLQGDTYVGGIAGAAEAVSDCVSIVELLSGTEKLGSVIGYTENREALINNRYLLTGVDIGGIDGISYAGTAESAPLETILADLPETLAQVTLRFHGEGETYTDLVVNLGDVLANYQLPAVPALDHCEGVWDGLPELETDKVYFDDTFEATYHTDAVVIQGDLMSGMLSVLIAQGHFTDGQTLKVTQLDSDGSVGAWEFRFTDGGKADSLRLLLPENCDASAIRIQLRGENGQWNDVDFTTKGSYAVFAVAEDQDAVRIVAVEKEHSLLLWILLAAGVLVVIVVLIFVLKKVKKKRGK